MQKELTRMHSCIGAPASHNRHLFPEQGSESLFNGFLNGRVSGLNLPSVVGLTVVSKFNEIPQKPVILRFAKITNLIKRNFPMKILLLSDTHGYIDQKILRYCKEADEVWHAGDIGHMRVMEEIGKVSAVRGVYGNIDGSEIRVQYPLDNRFVVEGVDVWITHIGGYPNRYEPRVREVLRANPPKLFIAGHSHILKVQYDKKFKLMHMNPGAVGKYGFHKARTMLRFEIEDSEIKNLEVIEFPRR